MKDWQPISDKDARAIAKKMDGLGAWSAPQLPVPEDKLLALKSIIINALTVFDLSPDDLDKYHKQDFWSICEPAITKLLVEAKIEELKRIIRAIHLVHHLMDEPELLERIKELSNQVAPAVGEEKE